MSHSGKIYQEKKCVLFSKLDILLDSIDHRSDIDQHACHYVLLSLICGHLDSNSLDMYFGPPDWAENIEHMMSGVAFENNVRKELKRRLEDLEIKVCSIHTKTHDDKYRCEWIIAHIRALRARQRKLSGEHLSFEEQTNAMYDVKVDQMFPKESLPKETLTHLNDLLPKGSGSILDRFLKMREKFLVPKEKYGELFNDALLECRTRVKKRLSMPSNEKCNIIYIDDSKVSWEAFEGFKRNATSDMHVNLARLISIDKFTQLPAHEGYPGHHYMFTIAEEQLVKQQGWMEFSVVNTFSPYSFISEGAAEWAAQELLWSSLETRINYLQKLASDAGLLSKWGGIEELERWCMVAHITDPLDELGRVHVRITQQFIDGEIQTLEEVRKQMLECGLRPDQSWPNAAFIMDFGAYIINYSFGKTLVRKWIASQRGCHWEAFAAFAKRPMLPSRMMQCSKISSL